MPDKLKNVCNAVSSIVTCSGPLTGPATAFALPPFAVPVRFDIEAAGEGPVEPAASKVPKIDEDTMAPFIVLKVLELDADNRPWRGGEEGREDVIMDLLFPTVVGGPFIPALVFFVWPGMALMVPFETELLAVEFNEAAEVEADIPPWVGGGAIFPGDNALLGVAEILEGVVDIFDCVFGVVAPLVELGFFFGLITLPNRPVHPSHSPSNWTASHSSCSSGGV
jgi:hypothetical protein